MRRKKERPDPRSGVHSIDRSFAFCQSLGKTKGLTPSSAKFRTKFQTPSSILDCRFDTPLTNSRAESSVDSPAPTSNRCSKEGHHMRVVRFATAFSGCCLLIGCLVSSSCVSPPIPSKTGSYNEAKDRCGNRQVNDASIDKPQGLECEPIVIANETNPGATGEGNPTPQGTDTVEYRCGSCS